MMTMMKQSMVKMVFKYLYQAIGVAGVRWEVFKTLYRLQFFVTISKLHKKFRTHFCHSIIV